MQQLKSCEARKTRQRVLDFSTRIKITKKGGGKNPLPPLNYTKINYMALWDFCQEKYRTFPKIFKAGRSGFLL